MSDNPRYGKRGKRSSRIYREMLYGRATAQEYVEAVRAEVDAELRQVRRQSVRNWLAGLILRRHRDTR